MDGRIGRLNCRCQVLGAPESAGALQARLERVVRERLAGEYDAALQVLADDPAVYILRRVQARLSLVLDARIDDSSIAQRWGTRMAGAVVRRIAREEEADNLVRFADQADYVAHFVIDLLQGHAWNRWFYGAFGNLQTLDTRDALHTVLEENRVHLPSILSYLHKYGGLEGLLAALNLDGRGWLWSLARGQEPLDPAEVSSLLSTAIELLDRLDLWRAGRPSASLLLDALLASVRLQIDWQDEEGLTNAVLDIAHFILHRGYLNRPARLDAGFQSRLREALASLDWLRAGQLETGLVALLVPPREALLTRPVRAGGRTLTRRQRQLLDDLSELLTTGALELDASAPDSAENALRLYAALVAHQENWAGDALAVEMIARLLEGWKWVRQGGLRAETLRRLAQGDSQGALRNLYLTEPAAESSFEFLASLGQAGSSVLQALEHDPGGTGESETIETQCAGIALLIRALLDARVPALFKITGFGQRPGLEVALLALFLTWAGQAGSIGDEIDPGLQVLAGIDPRSQEPDAIHSLDQLRTRWRDAGTPGEWQTFWLRLLAGQRLLQPDVIHLYRIERERHTFLIAGDESGKLWPHVQLLPSAQDGLLSLGDWLAVWTELAASPPVVIAQPEALRSIGTAGMRVLDPAEAGEEIRAVHRSGEERLRAVLELLAGHNLGDGSWDLTLALTANAVARLWARWLRGIADSSTPYLLTQLVWRKGRIYQESKKIVVELEPRPLDVTLQLSGYVGPVQPPWLADRSIEFKL